MYTEFLTTFTGANNDIPFATEYDYQLNSAQAPSIGAGASVTFRMALKVPADQPLGGREVWLVRARRHRTIHLCPDDRHRPIRTTLVSGHRSGKR